MFVNYNLTCEERLLYDQRVEVNQKELKEALCSVSTLPFNTINRQHLKIAMTACLLVSAAASPAAAIEPVGAAITVAREATKTQAFKETSRTAACISCGYCAKGVMSSAQCGNAAAASAFACGMVCTICLYATASLIPD